MRILRLPEAINKTGLSRATIYRHINKGEFPKPVPIGVQNSGWLEHELEEWIEGKILLRDGDLLALGIDIEPPKAME